MRVASLVPSATESLFALGLGQQVVAVTHECDYPPAATRRQRITRDLLPRGLDAAGIDRAVRDLASEGKAIYELDRAALAKARPDLVVTQALCEVCAVSVEDVRTVAAGLSSPPQVLSLDPTTLDAVLDSIRALAGAAGAAEAGEALLTQARERIDRVRDAVAGQRRPRVVALEWLDPPYVGGHWVPQLIALAGGEDPLAEPGERSRAAEWEEIAAARPEVVVCMPCGYGTERSAEEALARAETIAALGARTVVAVDASAYFSRPGPRLVDGLELLAHVLHPDRVPAPPAERVERLDLAPAPAIG